MTVVTFEVNFIGRVQGVGFRFLCLRKANSLGVKGWVRNAHKQDLVEAIFQGEKKNIGELVYYLKNNPYLIRVDNFTMSEVKTKEKFSGFEVRY